ncbi:DUF1697 domain-containing protein [Erysipelothrix sp. HDW6C]|uniref:DUF1697 domain-containing protein n=1 Tax=Erysipelothrix sp. HDW6C TaxID=2714930 RepID=UPI001409B4B4|nr:DUF1697 domain-containing protein [Erysipelothrix sp. HDW6C]QIK70617.1 DUF1697 domain-containing protein [Erysipelothrix sp. HDW6C]
MRHIALLRGINVGGKNKVPMDFLKSLCESLGYTQIKTYINSGNIIFDTDDSDASKRIHDGILQELNLDIIVHVISASQLAAVHALLEDHWVTDKTVLTDVMFVIDPTMDMEMPCVEGIDTIIKHPDAIIWHLNRADYPRSGVVKLMRSPVYKNVTVRNANTVRAIYALVNET